MNGAWGDAIADFCSVYEAESEEEEGGETTKGGDEVAVVVVGFCSRRAPDLARRIVQQTIVLGFPSEQPPPLPSPGLLPRSEGARRVGVVVPNTKAALPRNALSLGDPR